MSHDRFRLAAITGDVYVLHSKEAKAQQVGPSRQGWGGSGGGGGGSGRKATERQADLTVIGSPNSPESPREESLGAVQLARLQICQVLGRLAYSRPLLLIFSVMMNYKARCFR